VVLVAAAGAVVAVGLSPPQALNNSKQMTVRTAGNVHLVDLAFMTFLLSTSLRGRALVAAMGFPHRLENWVSRTVAVFCARRLNLTAPTIRVRKD